MQRALTVFQLDEVPAGHEHWLQESLNKVSSVEQAVCIADKHQLIADLAKKAGPVPECKVESMKGWAPLSIMYHSLQSSSSKADRSSNEERLGYASPTAFATAVGAEMKGMDYDKVIKKIKAASWFVHQLSLPEADRVKTIKAAHENWKQHCKDQELADLRHQLADMQQQLATKEQELAESQQRQRESEQQAQESKQRTQKLEQLAQELKQRQQQATTLIRTLVNTRSHHQAHLLHCISSSLRRCTQS